MNIIKILPALRLLAFPALLMGSVQFVFGLLSLFYFHDNIAKFFIPSALIMIFISLIFVFSTLKSAQFKINYKEAMLYVSLTWILFSLIACLPIQQIEKISFTDALFEAISALTTTGATILSGLDEQPKTFLMYRQFLQWLGGLGVVIFVVAILPMLNIGGMKILKAETPGPIKDDKIAPRITHSAQYLWYVYLGLTILCAIGYAMAGMNWYDAIAHSFSTVSTGGFSTHDASIGFFNSPLIELNADLFMILGAISFSLHFKFINRLELNTYFKDEETRIFFYLILFLSIVVSLILISNHFFTDFFDNISKAIFIVISFITSTGFGSGDFTSWPPQTALILIFAGYLGGCAGSTAGGNKIIRNILSAKLIYRQIKKIIHPRGIFSIKYNQNTLSDDILSSTVAFMTISASMTGFLTLLLTTTDLDFWSAFSAVASCLNVSGPAFGILSNNFQPVSDFGIWVLDAAMLLGRLEFFTLLVLFSKVFWKN